MVLYVLKLDSSKTLYTTIYAKIYQHESRADTIVFLLPKIYEDEHLSNCEITLNYILPDGLGKTRQLRLEPEEYNKNYLRCNLPAVSALTAVPGTIILWLTLQDMAECLILRSSEAEVEILPSKDICDYFDSEDLDRLDQINARLAKLDAEKADNIRYNKGTRQLQLSSKNNPIGDSVTVPADDYSGDADSEWEDMSSHSDDSGAEVWEDM